MSVKKKETKKDFEKQYNQLMEKSLINNRHYVNLISG